MNRSSWFAIAISTLLLLFSWSYRTYGQAAGEPAGESANPSNSRAAGKSAATDAAPLENIPMEQDDEPTLQPQTEGDETPPNLIRRGAHLTARKTDGVDQPEAQNLKVKSHQIEQTIAYSYKLISPPHQATLTPGLVHFQWELTKDEAHSASKKTKKRKPLVLWIESLPDHKVRRITTKFQGRAAVTVMSGLYLWRLSNSFDIPVSRSRIFKVLRWKSRHY